MKTFKLLCRVLFIPFLSILFYPLLMDTEVPLSIKILHYHYQFIYLYTGASANRNFSRIAMNQLSNFLSTPVNHSSDTLIDHLTVSSLNDSYQIPVNIYRNKTLLDKSKEAKMPTIIYIHGGGWMMEPSESLFYERFTSKGLVFIEIRYRLSPEAKFPIPLEDCYSVILNETIYKYSDRDKISVLGDSSGGNLGAALMFLLRDRGNSDLLFRNKHQILVYPATGTLDEFESHKKYHNWYILGKEDMDYFIMIYAKELKMLKIIILIY